MYTAQYHVGRECDQEAEEDAPFHNDTGLGVPERDVVRVIGRVVVEEVSLPARHIFGAIGESGNLVRGVEDRGRNKL